MTTVRPSWCAMCKHRINPGSCRAFEAIPVEFRLGFKHATVQAGQKADLVWELDKRKTDAFNNLQPFLLPAAGVSSQ